MKITFVKDCPPIVESGNSAYKKGDEADLRLGHALIELGYARDGWGKVKPEPVKETAVPEPESDTLPDDYRALQKLAKERDIPANQSKDDLIEALTNGNN